MGVCNVKVLSKVTAMNESAENLNKALFGSLTDRIISVTSAFLKAEISRLREKEWMCELYEWFPLRKSAVHFESKTANKLRMVKLTKQKERMQFQPKLQLFQVALSNSPTTVIVKLFKKLPKIKKTHSKIIFMRRNCMNVKIENIGQ